MSIDELADFIDTFVDWGCGFDKCNQCPMDKNNCDDIKSWLKSEVKA